MQCDVLVFMYMYNCTYEIAGKQKYTWVYNIMILIVIHGLIVTEYFI